MAKHEGRCLKQDNDCIANVSLGLIGGGSVIGIDGDGSSSDHSYGLADNLTVAVTPFLLEVFDKCLDIHSNIVLGALHKMEGSDVSGTPYQSEI